MTFFLRRWGALLTVLLGLSAASHDLSLAQANMGAMVTGGRTSQPIGHREFCDANPKECAIRARNATPARLTEALQERLAEINVTVNRSVKPVSDLKQFGKEEVWTYPDKAGDCEDYVLRKRQILRDEGVSLSNLLITVVHQKNGEGHAVLTVRTDQGDLVLDNLRKEVLPWDQTGYHYLKRQASDHTGRWVSIRDGIVPLVGSVD